MPRLAKQAWIGNAAFVPRSSRRIRPAATASLALLLLSPGCRKAPPGGAAKSGGHGKVGQQEQQTHGQVAPGPDADLRDRDLSGENLRDRDLQGAKLDRSILAGANLSDADLRRASLRWVDLSDVELGGADLRDADLRGATLGRQPGAIDLRGADLRGAQLCGADLSRAQMEDVDLRGAAADAETKWPGEIESPQAIGVNVDESAASTTGESPAPAG